MSAHSPIPGPRRRRAVAARLRALPRPLVAILLVGALLDVGWIMATAPLSGPDEIAHLAYIQHFAETGHPPDLGGGTRAEALEEASALDTLNLRSLVGVGSGKPSWTKADVENWNAADRKDLGGAARKDGSGPNQFAKNPPLYYVYASVPYRAFSWAGLFTRVTAIRLATGLLYLLTIALTWVLARELFGRRAVWRCTIAAGAVALEPMLAFMGATINPDSLLVAVWTGFAALAVATVRRGPSLWRVVGLCALATASILTHGRGLAIVPAALLTALVVLLRHRPPVRDLALWAGAGLAVAIVPLAVYKLAFAGSSSGTLYGGEANLAQKNFSVRELVSFIWQFYLPKLGFMAPKIGPQGFGYRQVVVEGFLGQFGSIEIRYPARVYDLFQLLGALGFAAMWACAVRHWQTVRGHLGEILVLAGMVVSMALLLHVASYRALLGGQGDPLITGRYVLPLVSMFGIAIAFVVGALPRRLGAALGGFVLGAGVLLQLGALGMTIARFYA